MKQVIGWISRPKIWTDCHGQDLIEYALMAGFIAIAAAVVLTGIAASISTIFSKVASTVLAAGTN